MKYRIEIVESRVSAYEKASAEWLKHAAKVGRLIVNQEGKVCSWSEGGGWDVLDDQALFEVILIES